MIDGFRHKGLEEIHVTGTTRRIGAGHVRKCVRVMQLLDVAGQPEEMNIAGLRFHGLEGKTRKDSRCGSAQTFASRSAGQARMLWLLILKTTIRRKLWRERTDCRQSIRERLSRKTSFHLSACL